MLHKKIKLQEELLRTRVEEERIFSKPESANQTVVTSQYFTNPSFWLGLFNIECELNDDLKDLKFTSPVVAVYNPIIYASELHKEYLKTFLTSKKPILFIGMNPGPWGMCQTGIPFGSITNVRDWMKLSASVQKPEIELSCRPVTGLNCTKTEQSGQRFWGLLESLCGEPSNFFANCFVYNFCPLAFFQASGKNITPAELKGDSRKTLQLICNKHLARAVEYLSPTVIICVGTYTKDRVNEILKNGIISNSITVKCMPHPSPRSLNNTNWAEKAEKWFLDNDIMKYLKADNQQK